MTTRNTHHSRADQARDVARTVLATDTSDELDALVLQAQHALRGTTAHLSMMTDRQVTLSMQGAFADAIGRGSELPFDDTICASALRSDEALVIPDTAADSRVSSIPAVLTGDVRAYLGAPIRAHDGAMIGVLCVIDGEPRNWAAEDLATLEDLAHRITVELDRLAAVSAAG